MISHLHPDAVRLAAEILGNGGLVALPTETVYGLGASMSSPAGIKRVFAVKGRPADHPLIVHGATTSILDDVGIEVNDLARQLASAVWPGPLSLLIRRSPNVDQLVTGGRSTVVVRVPAHDFFRNVVSSLGCPIAAPSANRFGRVSPTTAEHVLTDLGDDIDLIVDGGPSVVGVESSIVDTTTDPSQVLRHGGIPIEDLEHIAGVKFAEAHGLSRAPGMLASHYSPRCKILLAENPREASEILEDLPAGRSGLIKLVEPVSMYAATLYASLRACDEHGWTHAVAVLPPRVGLGRAIRDRLERAASPSAG